MVGVGEGMGGERDAMANETVLCYHWNNVICVTEFHYASSDVTVNIFEWLA